MTPNMRIFASEQGARDADRLLAENGFEERVVILPSNAAGREDAVVNEAIAAGKLPAPNRAIATRSLRQGRSLVAVRAPFGGALPAIELMEQGDVVDAAVLKSYPLSNPSPFSDAIGLPTLAGFNPSSNLISDKWTATGALGLLTSNGAPLSSLLRMTILTKKKGEWRSSFGLPLLSRTAAPFSSLFALPVLSGSKEGGWQSSFGLPLLAGRAAPLSNLFGLPTLLASRSKKK